MAEEKIIIENEEEEIVNVDEEVVNSTIEESVDVVEIADIQIVEVGVDSAFASLGNPNDMSVHGNLHGITDPDQHPIAAITNLRAELNSLNTVKTPQTLYSDKIGIANYYVWNDGAYDEVGYFVSFVPETSKIKLCDGSDIFGVTVDDAGFIGGQNAIIPRDNTYALVATTGLVDVKCESDVCEGDYVISNEHGWAAKTTSNFGYKVVSVNEKHGVLYASIVLGVQACTTDEIGKNLQRLESRVGVNETNIISAINVANQAYNKASEVETSNRTMSDKVDGALDTVDKVVSDVKDLSSQVSNSALISAQARAIAESAATSAESMRNEAVEKANEALVDTSELRKELEAKVAEIDTELDNTALELEATKEGFDETINDLKLDTEGQLADLKKEVEDNYATTTQLAAVKTENSDAVAALKQEVSDTYATTESVTSLKTETSDALTGFKQEVSETYATQEMLTGLETETGKALTDYKQEVTDTYATQELVTTLEKNTSKALADYKQEVQAGYATQEMVTKLEKDTSKALSDYKQEVTDTYATQTALTTLKTDTTKAIAASEEKATATYASKSDLTSFEGNTNIAMARIEQKADANGAYIQSTVANMDKYTVGPHSQADGFTRKQAQSVLEEGMVYVPTEDGITERYVGEGDLPTYERTFSKHYLYRWGEVSDGYGWVTVDQNYSKDKLNTSAPSVFFSNTAKPTVAQCDTYGYWYTNGVTLTGTAAEYEPYTLYKWDLYNTKDDKGNSKTERCWTPVATLAGNSQSRAVSQIRQDANSIEAAVTGLNGEYAGIKADLSGTQATVQQLSKYANNGATIKTEANETGSAVTIQSYTEANDGTITEQASLVLNVAKDADGKPTSALSIDADNIKFSGQTLDIYVDSTHINGALTIGQLPSTVAEKSDVKTKTSELTNDSDFQDITGVVNIVDGRITADYIKTLNLEVGNQIKMGQNATISWDNVDSKPTDFATTTDVNNAKTAAINTASDDATKKANNAKSGAVNEVKGLGYQTSSQVKTEISESKIRTDQIEVTDLNAFGATIGGFKITQDRISDGADTFGLSSNTESGLRFYAGDAFGGYNTTYVDFTQNLLEAGYFASSYDSKTKKFSVSADSPYAIKYTSSINIASIKSLRFNCAKLMWETEGSNIEDLESFGWVFCDEDGLDVDYVTEYIKITDFAFGWHTDTFPVSGQAYIRFYFDTFLNSAYNDEANFRVYNDGRLYAWAADITGNITANSGTLHNCIIEEDCEIRGTLTSSQFATNEINLTVDEANIIAGRLAFEKYASETNTGGYLFEVNNGYMGSALASLSMRTRQSGDTNKAELQVYSALNSNLNKFGNIGIKIHGYTNMWKTAPGVTIDAPGIYLNATDTGELTGTWVSDNDLSDSRIKNTIEELEEPYELLFDNLIARRYKYNNGTSNRFHTGYVAQEVVDAIEKAGLTTQDFAGVMLLNEGTEDERWYLRRDEFVALNTWQIQTLKSRVNELEQKNAELEKRLEKIESLLITNT